MELSQAGINWRACYPDGEHVRFPTTSESGIRLLISDYPAAIETAVIVDGRLVPVGNLAAARAALAQPGESQPESSLVPESIAKGPINMGLRSADYVAPKPIPEPPPSPEIQALLEANRKAKERAYDRE